MSYESWLATLSDKGVEIAMWGWNDFDTFIDTLYPEQYFQCAFDLRDTSSTFAVQTPNPYVTRVLWLY